MNTTLKITHATHVRVCLCFDVANSKSRRFRFRKFSLKICEGYCAKNARLDWVSVRLTWKSFKDNVKGAESEDFQFQNVCLHELIVNNKVQMKQCLIIAEFKLCKKKLISNFFLRKQTQNSLCLILFESSTLDHIFGESCHHLNRSFKTNTRISAFIHEAFRCSLPRNSVLMLSIAFTRALRVQRLESEKFSAFPFISHY